YKEKGEKSQRRSFLAGISVEKVITMADFVARNCPKESAKIAQQVLEILKTSSVVKIDDSAEIRLLPIYETMRTVLAYECLKQRPIILSVYQMSCEPYEGESAKYRLAAIHTLVYKLRGGKLTPVKEEIDKDRPCVAFQAYQMVNSSLPIKCPDGAEFFAGSDDSVYIEGLKTCDLALLIQIYAALHPPYASPLYLDDDN